MALDKLAKNSLNVGLHAVIMGLLIIPLLWVSGGLTPRQDEPPQPLLESNLPFMLTPTAHLLYLELFRQASIDLIQGRATP